MIKLPEVSSKYGAPMGRVDQPNKYSGYQAIPDMAHKFNLVRVRINSGGYDSGGAYWGQRLNGQSLYWATNETGTIDRWLDAKCREDAKRIIRAEFPNCTFYR